MDIISVNMFLYVIYLLITKTLWYVYKEERSKLNSIIRWSVMCPVINLYWQTLQAGNNSHLIFWTSYENKFNVIIHSKFYEILYFFCISWRKCEGVAVSDSSYYS